MDIKAPDLGVDSAEVSEIMVEVGDVIAKDDNIILLESDKASVEVPSSAAGKVTKISVAVGDQVSEGMVLIELESDTDSDSQNDSQSTDTENKTESGTDKQNESQDNQSVEKQSDTDTKANAAEANTSQPAKQASEQAGEQVGKSTTHALPDLGVDEAQVSEIMVSVGDIVTADQSILLIESDKASVEVPAPEAGKVEKILVQAGDMVANGQDFIVIIGEGTASTSTANESKAETSESQALKPADSTNKTESAEQSAKSQTTGEPKQAAKSTTITNATNAKLSEAQVNEKMVDIYAGPAVRKLARQLGVDISQVTGSALNDRILKEDLFAHVKDSLNTKKVAPTSSN